MQPHLLLGVEMVATVQHLLFRVCQLHTQGVEEVEALLAVLVDQAEAVTVVVRLQTQEQ
jgi:hypothetical protein